MPGRRASSRAGSRIRRPVRDARLPCVIPANERQECEPGPRGRYPEDESQPWAKTSPACALAIVMGSSSAACARISAIRSWAAFAFAASAYSVTTQKVEPVLTIWTFAAPTDMISGTNFSGRWPPFHRSTRWCSNAIPWCRASATSLFAAIQSDAAEIHNSHEMPPWRSEISIHMRRCPHARMTRTDWVAWRTTFAALGPSR
jgi:hypothetical protein